MNKTNQLSGWKDKALYTPGPLTTSKSVKQAMLRDVGHRDLEFIQIVSHVRKKLLELGHVTEKKYTSVLLQGSGTYSIEAVLSTATPPDGKWLIIDNGAYGRRIVKIADVLKINNTVLKYPENSLPDLTDIKNALENDGAISHFAMVHSETTTGMVNPIEDVSKIIKKYNKIYFVDAMSSFGAYPIHLEDLKIDYLACTANKNIEGVPGFAFVIVKISVLLKTEGNARSFTLDLLDQWKGFEKNGQFRFSPPTHSILAFNQALKELREEGGVEGRAARYRENYETLIKGMREMGFKEYLSTETQGYIIASFLYPDDPNFDFEAFYNKLNDRDYVIYPGKVGDADCFRLATCGRLFKNDILNVLAAIKATIDEMGVKLK